MAASAAGQSKADKESRARVRACLDKEVTHIRMGDWSRLPHPDVEVTPLGHVRDLHGTVCTCCPRRGGSRG